MQERQVTTRHDAPAGAPVPGARHAEPDRVRGDLPAARGAARPLPAADQRRLPGPRRGARLLGRRSGATRTRSSWTRSSIATSCSTMQRAVETVHADDGILGYAVDLVTATRETSRSRWARAARVARAAQAVARQGRRRGRATSSRPTTSSSSPCRRSRIGSRCGPAVDPARGGRRTWCAATVFDSCPAPPVRVP